MLSSRCTGVGMLVALVLAGCTRRGVEPQFEEGAPDGGSHCATIESQCNGLDEDCDGRPDISRSVFLQTAPMQSFHGYMAGFSWVFVDGGLSSISASPTGVSFRRWSTVLEAQTPLVPLGVSGNTGVPFLAKMGQASVIAWGEHSSESSTSLLVAARVDDEGTLFPMSLPDGGASGHVTEEIPGWGSWRPTPSNDGQCILLSWADVCAGQMLRLKTISAFGSPIAGPVDLVTKEPACNTLGAIHSVMPVGPSRFFVVASEADSLVWRQFNCSLAENVSAKFEIPFKIFDLDLVAKSIPASDGGESGRLALAIGTSTRGQIMLWQSGPDGGTLETLHQGAGWVRGVDLLFGEHGPFVVWGEGDKPPHTNRILAKGPGTALLDLTPPGTSLPDYTYPTVAKLENGMFVMGYPADAGDRTDHHAQFFCEP